jgi:hypothetical protein
MKENNLESLIKGSHAIISWDIDGPLNETKLVERESERYIPGFIPGIQKLIQYPGGILEERRAILSYKFLGKRKPEPNGIDALFLSYCRSLELANESSSSPIIVKNVIFTERPASTEKLPFDDLLMDQLKTELELRQLRGIINGAVTVDDLIQGYFANPYRGDLTKVKPDAAIAVTKAGVDLYLLEDKLSTAKIVKNAAENCQVSLLTDRDNPLPLGIIPVHSAHEYVENTFKDILKKHLK